MARRVMGLVVAVAFCAMNGVGALAADPATFEEQVTRGVQELSGDAGKVRKELAASESARPKKAATGAEEAACYLPLRPLPAAPINDRPHWDDMIRFFEREDGAGKAILTAENLQAAFERFARDVREGRTPDYGSRKALYRLYCEASGERIEVIGPALKNHVGELGGEPVPGGAPLPAAPINDRPHWDDMIRFFEREDGAGKAILTAENLQAAFERFARDVREGRTPDYGSRKALYRLYCEASGERIEVVGPALKNHVDADASRPGARTP